MTTPTIPVVVVAGYLGAGKTTLINELLTNSSRKIAVIVNDFGSVNIDAALISSVNGDTIELTNGCVCCALGTTLADTMLSISDREQLPDMVVIEASGVADPSAVSANAYIGGFHLAATLVLVDAVNASTTSQNKLLGETFHRQLRGAHLLLVTKHDMATSEQYATCVELCKATGIPYVHRENFSLESLSDTQPLPPLTTSTSEHDVSFTQQMLHSDSMESVEQLKIALQALPLNAVRAKGIVTFNSQNYLVQRVGTFTSIVATDLPPTGIVVIYAD